MKNQNIGTVINKLMKEHIEFTYQIDLPKVKKDILSVCKRNGLPSMWFEPYIDLFIDDYSNSKGLVHEIISKKNSMY